MSTGVSRGLSSRIAKALETKSARRKAIRHWRNLIERFFNEIEHVRQIASRFDKHAANRFAVTLAATRVCLKGL
jgi:transposase